MVTGFSEAGYNFINFGSLDNSPIIEFQSKKTPFCCMPKKNITDKFDVFMRGQNLKKGGNMFAMEFTDLQSFE